MYPCSETHSSTWEEHGQSLCVDMEGDWDWWLDGQMMCMIQSHFTKILALLTHLRCLLGDRICRGLNAVLSPLENGHGPRGIRDE